MCCCARLHNFANMADGAAGPEAGNKICHKCGNVLPITFKWCNSCKAQQDPSIIALYAQWQSKGKGKCKGKDKAPSKPAGYSQPATAKASWVHVVQGKPTVMAYPPPPTANAANRSASNRSTRSVASSIPGPPPKANAPWMDIDDEDELPDFEDYEMGDVEDPDLVAAKAELAYLNKQIRTAQQEADCPAAQRDLEQLQARHASLRQKCTNKKPLEEKIRVLENSRTRALAKLEKANEACAKANAIYNAIQEKILGYEAELSQCHEDLAKQNSTAKMQKSSDEEDLVAQKVAAELEKRQRNFLAHLEGSLDPAQKDAIVAALNRSASPPPRRLDEADLPNTKKTFTSVSSKPNLTAVSLGLDSTEGGSLPSALFGTTAAPTSKPSEEPKMANPPL